MAAWWRERRRLARFVADLLRGELARARRSADGLPPLPWADSLRLDADLGADSLERLSLAAALAEALQLHRSGIDDALLARRFFGDWLDVAEAGLERHDGELTFRTSGSTGLPRSCAHALADLEQEADTLAGLLVRTRRIVSVVPCHHIYGFLFTVLLPGRLGLAEADVVDARTSSPGGVARLAGPGDAIVGHPESWRAFVRSGARAAGGVVGVTSTAPCPDDLAQAVERAGVATLLQVYGASETAGIGWRSTPARPYELMPFWRRAGDGLVRTGADGRERAMPSPDHLDWQGERHFNVLARRDGAVQVGGVNVALAPVREALLAHPGVDDAVVRLMRADEGTRLKAFVVPAPGVADAAALERSLREWIDANLSPPERPKALRFGRALPVGDAGKLTDWPIDEA